MVMPEKNQGVTKRKEQKEPRAVAKEMSSERQGGKVAYVRIRLLSVLQLLVAFLTACHMDLSLVLADKE